MREKRFEALVKAEIVPFRPGLFDKLAKLNGAKLPRYTLQTDGTHHFTKKDAIDHLRTLVKQAN